MKCPACGSEKVESQGTDDCEDGDLIWSIFVCSDCETPFKVGVKEVSNAKEEG